MDQFVRQHFGSTLDDGPVVPPINPHQWRQITKQQIASRRSMEDLLVVGDERARQDYDALRKSLSESRTVTDKKLGSLKQLVQRDVYVQTEKKKYFVPDTNPLINPAPVVIEFPSHPIEYGWWSDNVYGSNFPRDDRAPTKHALTGRKTTASRDGRGGMVAWLRLMRRSEEDVSKACQPDKSDVTKPRPVFLPPHYHSARCYTHTNRISRVM